MKVLVIGGAGMAGHMVTLFLRNKGYEVTTLSLRHVLDQQTVILDVCNMPELETYLKQQTFDVVINCAGVLIKESKENRCKAILVNAHLPHYLEQFYQNTKVKVIHISTDCVFSGYKGPYTESAAYDADSFYGRTKSLGEIDNIKDLTFRMSIIGPELRSQGVGLLNWFLNQKGTVYGFDNVYWSGITTLELARGIEQAIHENLCGIYHLVPDEVISKYQLLKIIQEKFHKNDVDLVPKQVEPHNKGLINTRTDFNFKIPSYSKMIEEQAEWIKKYRSLYPSYYIKESE